MHIKEKISPQVAALMVMDAMLIMLAGGLALLARFDFSFNALPGNFAENWMNFLPLQILVTIGVFYLRRMYHYM